MNRSMTMIAVFALAACEGEPPKVPTGQPAPAAAALEQPSEEEANHEATPSAPASVADGGAAAMCPCACACGAGAASMAAADGGAPLAADGGLATATLPPPETPAIANGRVVGTVTTMPAMQAANAVVYLEDAPVDPNAKTSSVVDNRMMNFIPFVTIVPVGGHVTFHNSDPFPHNVFSPDHERFDMGAISQNNGRARAFKSPGVYTVLCNLHPNMIGYVLVTPSSYYARVRGGRYAIKDVPNGTYRVTAWAPRQEPLTQTVTVKSGDATIDFNLHR